MSQLQQICMLPRWNIVINENYEIWFECLIFVWHVWQDFAEIYRREKLNLFSSHLSVGWSRWRATYPRRLLQISLSPAWLSLLRNIGMLLSFDLRIQKYLSTSQILLSSAWLSLLKEEMVITNHLWGSSTIDSLYNFYQSLQSDYIRPKASLQSNFLFVCLLFLLFLLLFVCLFVVDANQIISQPPCLFWFVWLFVFCLHTKPQLFSRVRGKSEPKDGHGGNEEAGHNQVGEVVQRSPPGEKVWKSESGKARKSESGKARKSESEEGWMQGWPLTR